MLSRSAVLHIWRFVLAAMLACFGEPVAAQSAAPAPLLGDLGGVRARLAAVGIALGLTDTESLFGNVAGGVKQGATLQGLTEATLQADLDKSIGLAGGTIYASALQIHGRNFSPYYLDNLQNVNTTEAQDGTRLWELWYDQTLAHGLLDLRIGQQSIDQEFMVSQFGGVFSNMMSGWPILTTADLYAGGPAYPLSSLAVRLLVTPSREFAVQAAVFDDNPPGGSFDDDPANHDAGGIRFNLQDGALFITEANVSLPATDLPGTYKIGGWYDSGWFGDFDATPSGRMHGNYGAYAMADQTIWASGARSLNFLFRILGAPADRNLVDLSANAGFTITAPLAHRPYDILAMEVGIAHANGTAPVHGIETALELTYAAQIRRWLVLQPDVQFIVNPGAGQYNPARPGQHLHNAWVVGVRSISTF
jgi:porin